MGKKEQVPALAIFVQGLDPIWSYILAIFENIDPILDKNTERIRKKNIDSTRREKRIKANAKRGGSDPGPWQRAFISVPISQPSSFLPRASACSRRVLMPPRAAVSSFSTVPFLFLGQRHWGK